MSKKTIGIDFGTSNSAVAIASGEAVKVAVFHRATEIDPNAPPPSAADFTDTVPTVMFFPAYDPAIHFGHHAVAHYLFTGLEGRFIQSMKTYLPSKSFTQTIIRNRPMEIQDLVAAFLSRFLKAAEKALGEPLEGDVVLGRPARFSLEDDADRLAEERLKGAAERAGLSGFRMLIEPVAAALAYEATLSEDQVVLVADLGGGTSDFTLMRVGPSHRGLADRRQSILASRGIPIAGDKFDGEIVRACLLDAFGAGSSYVAMTESAPVPHWIFQKLLQWNLVSFLKSRTNLEFLKKVHQTSDRPEAIGALIRLIEDDQGYLLFRAVERAKRGIAEHLRVPIADEEHALSIEGTLTRQQFEDATRGLVEQIHQTALSTLEAANMRSEQIDAVFMTGGTSLVRPVRAAFEATFGAERIKAGRTFTSVVDGLARSGASAF